jgi:ribosomal protein S27E
MLRFPSLPKGCWVRVCQECGNKQEARDPKTIVGDKWRDLKCKRCKSESMDFGQSNHEIEEEE